MNKIIKIVAVTALMTPALFANTAACKGCHGADFEKKALGKSKVVKDMSKADFIAAMKGYKDGSYGGAMKGMMKGQVAKLDEAAITAIADELKLK
ncbi:cytochrome C [Sulfurovum sp. bin170]|uniref:c-type cytochrome n=1 Tax=Sulfurovum sp. bin170 TaxID=2695268 RepID=UPI0013DF7667|nr:cytochrome C [Sulfurovum sp. bin170]NEW59681.1 cytochrome C [Sulfurovum sp. bin170]